MRTSLLSIAVLALSLPACGSSDSDGSSGKEGTTDSKDDEAPPSDVKSEEGEAARVGKFDPPPPAEGYERIAAATVHDVAPGDDVTYCQYVMGGLDHDVDVIDVGGYQSAYGHHAVAFSFQDTGEQTIGDSFPCMGTEVSSGEATTGPTGAFLGGPAGAGAKASRLLPEGVAFRLKKGNGVMLNVHYLNTGDVTIDGDAVVDLKLAEPDASRQIAGMFVNVNAVFTISPSTETQSSVDCVAGGDVQIIAMSNHMHDFGTSVSTQVTRKDGTVEMMHDDPAWTYDMQFNPSFTRWSLDEPFVIHAGDTVRTSCTWSNDTASAMNFPREMCIGVGFALTSGDHPSAPSCIAGRWMPELL